MKQSETFFTPFQKLFLFIFCLGVVGWVSYLIHGLILLILVSFVFSYLISPMVDRLESTFSSRIFAILVLYIVFFTSLAFLLVYFVPILTSEFSDLSKVFPRYASNLQGSLVEWNYKLTREFPSLQEYRFIENVQEEIQTFLVGVTKGLPNLFFSVLSVFSYSVIVPIILFVFLLQGRDMKKDFLRLIPNKYFETFMYLLFNIGEKLGNYLRGILIETVIVGGLSIIFLLFLGVDYAYLLGGVAGIINIIPYVGPIIGAIPAIIIFYLKMGTLKSIVYLVIMFCIVQLVDNVILKPIIYSRSVDLNPIVVLISLLLGGMMAGVWGLILAVPIAGVLKLISSQMFREWQYRRQQRYESLSFDQNRSET